MSHLIKVKICGITNGPDAIWATNLGADYIGLNFCKESKRKISSEKASEIVEGLPPFVKVVGVFMNPSLADLEKTVKSVKFSFLQFHGEETAQFLEEVKSKFGLGVWKAFSIKSEEDLNSIPSYLGIADAILADRPKQEPTMETPPLPLDWNLAAKAKSFGIPLMLAGGLTLENVSNAVAIVKPQGVDVASGVEKNNTPRKKDIDKMKIFIQQSKGTL